MAFQANLSSVSAMLKEVYPGEIEDEFNNECALWALLDSEKVQLAEGQHLVRPFRVGRNQGIGSRNDGDSLPASGRQSLQRAQINMSSTYLVGNITGRVIRSSYDDQAAFENALSEEIKFDLTDMATEVCFQLYGLQGQRTTVNGNVSSSTSVVVNSTQYLAANMYVEFWNGASNQTVNDAGLTNGQTGTLITAVNNATNTLTVTTAQTITSGAGVSRAGNNTAQVTTKEAVGLDFMLDDGTDYSSISNYFGVSRVTYPILYGNRIDAAKSTTENLMQKGFDAARQIGGGIVDVITLDYASRRVYSNLLTSTKRYPIEGINAPEFAGGIKVSKDLRTQLGEGLSFSGAMVLPSRLAPPAKMYGLDTKSFHIYQQSDIEWIMNGDSILHPLLASNNQDGYEFSLFYDFQVYDEAPNRSFKLVNAF